MPGSPTGRSGRARGGVGCDEFAYALGHRRLACRTGIPVARSGGRPGVGRPGVISTKRHPSRTCQRGGLRRRAAIRADRPTGDGTTRTYLLAGLLICRRCGRRMDSHWVNDRPGYRCRHGRINAKRRTAPDIPSLDPHEMAQHPRANHTLIVCDELGCRLAAKRAGHRAARSTNVVVTPAA